MCEQLLCPACTAFKTVSPATLVVCGLCGELAVPLLRLKRETASLGHRLLGAFAFPFRGHGLATWGGLSLWLWVTSLFGVIITVLGWAVALTSLFRLTRSTARGNDALELSDYSDMLRSVYLPSFRFLVAMAPAWAGALLAMSLDQAWVNWTALLVAALWCPTAFIGAATDARFIDLLNPLRVLGATSRIGKDFGVYLVAVLVVSLVMLLSLPLSSLAQRLPVPILSGVLAQMALFYGPFVGARIAGLVLLLHGPAFGWGDESDLYEPVLGDAQPTGALPDKVKPSNPLPAEIELAEPEAPIAMPVEPRARPVEPLPPAKAPLDASALPSLAEQSALSIREAMRAGKTETAVDGFRATGLVVAEQLSFDELVWLGQTAASFIDFETAELAFRTAAGRTAPSESLGRARVMLARLLAERLNRRADATLWMQRVLAEQPGTAAARYATSWLGGPTSPHVGP